ncbi:MAG: hypothetical protein COZ46_07375 [Verrucomicrobia bacterium CG_4_10_14_3_um_filter_43_23]|nr:MAG: hypothetical protein AUJ82_02235 [Verrucomicrobia bacterium CG1_02_43_26]PIP58835.1 MAG: hypothetical protein COX01_06600 [Verrucomicrobia bacterium CG22_combo_CG10-13_8_21_14_all_43_17]PIX57759.1 MAG: hypothetical protein COZ46_07375 [Verrucomicrobia bacterium CG_4_10_14_3_um_filter_43_23]PIY61075.1 MAG: hypothetical protein COY94_07230 [Verrucomicrobia bacterium CG_4_10_14_0_8_um_filter_43_34]PJA44227.1 MAG: hypothetical protein CO175_03985 [Verrucomicrobia bacterium CG_4_9_14_3_um_fi
MKTIVLITLIAIAGLDAVYAAIPQSITCYTQFGFTQKELEDEEASILFFENLFQVFQSNLDQHTGHEDLKQLCAQANTKFIEYRNLVNSDTPCSKAHCIATESLALTLGQQLRELIAKKAERFGHNYNEAQKKQAEQLLSAFADGTNYIQARLEKNKQSTRFDLEQALGKQEL